MTAPARSGAGVHNGGFANVGHGADEPSNRLSSRKRPYWPSLHSLLLSNRTHAQKRR